MFRLSDLRYDRGDQCFCPRRHHEFLVLHRHTYHAGQRDAAAQRQLADAIHSADGSDAFGLCYVERCAEGEGNDLSGTCRIRNLSVPIYKWGRLYESIIKTIIEGSYHADLVDKKDQATNYWWGMDSGAVDIVLSQELPSNTSKLVNLLRRDIIDGRFHPFEGELRSQEGIVRTKNDTVLTSSEIIQMDWLNENIIGEIPTIDSLTDEAKTTVRFSGVSKTKKEIRP